MRYTRWIAVSLLGSNNSLEWDGHTMDNSILFEENYSQLIKSALYSAEAEQHEAGQSINEDDYVRKLITESVCVIMPERIEGRDYFIDLAKEIAEAYLIDIVIRERKDRITVTYTLDYEAGFSCLKPIIQLADELIFQNREDHVFISLDYFTHATYCSGRVVCP